MTRHGRNATNSAVYSYHERKKDTTGSGYGSQSLRLNKDAIKGFDCCSLTLQPCRNPVCTPEGWLFDKEVILEYILSKQQEYEASVKKYEKYKRKIEAYVEAEKEESDVQKRLRFEEKEDSIMSKRRSVNTSSGSSLKRKNSTLSSSTSDRMQSFWLPSETPDTKHAKTSVKNEMPNNHVNLTSSDCQETLDCASRNAKMARLTNPPQKSEIVVCPMSKKPIKMKHLIEVKFTEINPVDQKKDPKGKAKIERLLSMGDERFKCPITNDVLRNTSEIYVIKSTGDVVTETCVKKIIRPGGMVHPITGEKLKESDLIKLQKGGTGFSSSNDQLTAKKYGPSLAVA